MMKGSINAQTAADVNSKMEGAIEQLREKYERKAEQEAKEAAIKSGEDKVSAAQAAAEAKKADEERVDMRMDDPEMEALRKQRLAALHEATKAKKQHMDDGGGEVREILEEDFLKEVTSTHLVIVHFYHEEFMTCKVMDKHLRILAPRCVGTKVLRLNASKSPFFVAKLKVKVLPSLCYFKDGVIIGKQTGFEGLVESVTDEDFSTAKLWAAFRRMGVVRKLAGGADEEDAEDEAVESGLGGWIGKGASGDFSQKLDQARKAMLAALDDEDDL